MCVVPCKQKQIYVNCSHVLKTLCILLSIIHKYVNNMHEKYHVFHITNKNVADPTTISGEIFTSGFFKLIICSTVHKHASYRLAANKVHHKQNKKT